MTALNGTAATSRSQRSFKNSPQRAAGQLAGDPATDPALDALFLNGVHIA